jgi:hypothetical protein
MTDFDIEQFRLREPFVPVRPGKSPPHSPRHKTKEEFLKGPISIPWLRLAGRLTRRSWCVAIELWLLAGMRRSRTVALSTQRLAAWGVSRRASYRALNAMERAGLVSVSRQPGCLALVTILGAQD